MQPHAEFVKREAESNAVGHRRTGGGGSGVKQEIRPHAREQKDAVIEMMYVGAMHMQVKTRHALATHQEADDSSGDERQQEAEKHEPRQRAGIGWEHTLPVDPD